MQSVRRYPLAFFAFLALCAGCGGARMHAVSTPAATSEARVVAAVQANPAVVALAPVRTVAKVAAQPVKAQAKPAAVTRKAVRTVTTSRPRTVVKAAPVVVAPAPVKADAYPYRTSAGNSADAWGFTQRQCVSYAAWRLSNAGHAISNVQDGWGSASNWDDTARRLGMAVTTKASVGSIAQWNPGESSSLYAPGSSTPGGRFAAGSYGHVGYVTAVYADGSVQVAQYNATGDRAFSSMHMTAPRYLHVA